MSSMEHKVQECSSPIEQAIYSFAPITLSSLKDKAELMERRDNKYVLNTEQVLIFLNHAQSQFDMLEIGGSRQFHYLSHYYDSADFTTHADHNKGRRRRVKIRHRHYVDSNDHFFEIKLKGQRKLTQKLRIAFNPQDLGCNGLNSVITDYYCTILEKYYGYGNGREWWVGNLKHSISVGYYRITLVSKTEDSRITMDNCIYFIDSKEHPKQEEKQKLYLNNNKWVVEVKSPTGRTDIDRWLFMNKSRPVSLCSKYALGINLLKLTDKNNRFSRVLRRCFSDT